MTISEPARCRCVPLVALALSLAHLADAGADTWRIAEPGVRWSFPEDHWAHDGYRTEWWYLTGHLTPEGETVPRFGYQLTFFRIGLARETPPLRSAWATRALVMGHAAVSDLTTGRHVFSDVLRRDVELLGGFGTYPDTTIAWCRAPAGTAAPWTLSWNGTAFDISMADDARGIAFTLSTHPEKPLVFQGPGGYSRKGRETSQASLYYSFTRLATSGKIRVGETTWTVSGTSWMDKEIGSNQLGASQVGWDWFSLQLDDGRELMLYALRDAGGDVDAARGTIVSPEGTTRFLERDAWSVRVTDHWTSAATGNRYPSAWTIAVPGEGIELRVSPEIPDQENVSSRSSGIAYWEGAVEVRAGGAHTGRGYVELTGYGRGDRPRL